ncbi:MAG: HDOD domain-containing protein [Dehalococcoidia bacterium]|nr:HDOD domain-containing protein [Dehalococcoidia bacterium]
MVRPKLPMLPPARARAITILSVSAPDPLEVTDIVSSDPALATAVIRASNSAWSAPRTAVHAVDTAIIRIGPKETLQIVGAAVLNSTFEELELAGLNVEDLWQYVVATGLLTEYLLEPDAARDVRAAAYSAGLLHDIGRLAMAAEDPEAYGRVVSSYRSGTSVLEAERREFGAHHTVRGVEAAEAWGVARPLHGAILNHHDPLEHLSPLALAVTRATQIVWRMGIGDGVRVPASDEEREGLTAEDEWVLSKVGGADALRARVEWFRGAMRPDRDEAEDELLVS